MAESEGSRRSVKDWAVDTLLSGARLAGRVFRRNAQALSQGETLAREAFGGAPKPEQVVIPAASRDMAKPTEAAPPAPRRRTMAERWQDRRTETVQAERDDQARELWHGLAESQRQTAEDRRHNLAQDWARRWEFKRGMLDARAQNEARTPALRETGTVMATVRARATGVRRFFTRARPVDVVVPAAGPVDKGPDRSSPTAAAKLTAEAGGVTNPAPAPAQDSEVEAVLAVAGKGLDKGPSWHGVKAAAEQSTNPWVEAGRSASADRQSGQPHQLPAGASASQHPPELPPAPQPSMSLEKSSELF
ncbi:hypothetical protein [Streptodolium elevatio]|uniref:Uncharacterized protein n=1 Tax=Streptodolium elevatio TaxID=3157996 RepID=A0ABV3DNR8_9ACTN